jgi:hypothetical protein
MKRILLISVILAAMLLTACAAPATTPTTSDTLLVTTAKPAPEPSATFTTPSFDQTYYESTIDYEVRITLTDYIRGEQAWQLIKEANTFNTLPETGFEYILAKVRFEYLNGPTPNTAYEVSSVWFNAVSSKGQDYDMTWLVNPGPSIDANLYPGASHEGWVSFQVAVDDIEPLMTFGRRVDGTGGIWFKLYEAISVPASTPSPGYSRSNPVGTGVPLSIGVMTSGIGGDEESWSDYVYIYYDVENNGAVYLASYKVYLTITCAGGSKIQVWASGRDILVGQKWSTKEIADVGSKEVVSVEITNWELQAGTPPEVIYEITGTANEVDVTLNNATGGTEQYSDVSVPKKYSYSSFPENFLYISAQNAGDHGGVTVTIYVKGEVSKTSSSYGAYTIATASGMK